MGYEAEHESEYIDEYPGHGGTAGRRVGAFFVALVLIGLVCVLFVFFRYQYGILVSVEHDITAVRRDIEEQNEITQTLMHEKAMHGSAEYYEKIARDRLNLVYKNDIVFRIR
ncbi:MAG: septum formation initiator family protein [Defluviitaleaceae bacterium]|nr:septum formation initiator family protein [Defluviitaleaceae bacterium]MCL2835986.1 septum formation initiator family protein [Defluviitaleaceae bacterium]